MSIALESIINKHFSNSTESIISELKFLWELGDEGWREVFRSAIEDSSNSERFITSLSSYVKEYGSSELLIKEFCKDIEFLRLLERVFSQSPFLTEVALRYPNLPLHTYNSSDLRRSLSSQEWVERLNLPDFNLSEEDFISCLRERELISLRGDKWVVENLKQYLGWEYRKCLFRIAVRDIFLHQDVVSVAEDLSNLADGLLNSVFHIFYYMFSKKYGVPLVQKEGLSPSRCRFVILAMGKLGGRELNFSSDIDLLFLYEGEGETSKGISNREFFSWLGQDLIRFFSEHGESGIIYRVDMRLRPYGKSGSLVETIANAVEYYYQYGRAWERQALVKCRPCAGDLSLGFEFLESMRAFVFPKFFDDKTLEDVSRTKTLAEKYSIEQGRDVYDVKLGKGGIRDIEFTVQLLQMLNGGRSPSLRTTNTVDAINKLSLEGYLKPFEADTLIKNYKFLREVEHRLQVEYGTQKHRLPESLELLNEFARRLGYESGEAFLNVYLLKTDENRKILKNFLSAHATGNLWIYELISKEPITEELLNRMRGYRFENPEKAKEFFVSLVDGPPHNLNPLHVRETVIKVIPNLCVAFSKMKSPDASLERFCSQVLKIRMPGILFSIISENPSLCEVFVNLTSLAPSLSEIWLRNPGVLEVLFQGGLQDVVPLVSDLKEILEAMKNTVSPSSAHYRLKEEEFIRIATGDLLGWYTVYQVNEQLTHLAEVILNDITKEELDNFTWIKELTELPFAIIGLGKIGGYEMTYGSDLDLVFVYDDSEKGKNFFEELQEKGYSPVEFFSKVASKIIERLKQPTQFGSLYEIDSRLRPYGSKGVLAIGYSEFEEYYSSVAEVWEKLALMKGRVIFSGSTEFSSRLEGRLQTLAFSFDLTSEDIERAEYLRAKSINLSPPEDLKKAEGGLAELELIIRWWQRMYSESSFKVRTQRVREAINALANEKNDLIENWNFLLDTFDFYLKVLNRYRLFTGARNTLIPENLPQDVIEMAFGEIDLFKELVKRREKVHRFYLLTLGEVRTWVKRNRN
ncbi:MAG: hypothetical protein N3G21_06060 [Candidatus Hydrogenedentes bacterium]|nr:hypothetical protein [Candidatus Hydrogenedentota bacterium]